MPEHERCACGCGNQATVQVALRNPRRAGRWHLSQPMCKACAETYGHGGVTRFDGREVLAL